MGIQDTIVNVYPRVEYKEVDGERYIDDFIPILSDDIELQVSSAGSGEVTCRQDLLH